MTSSWTAAISPRETTEYAAIGMITFKNDNDDTEGTGQQHSPDFPAGFAFYAIIAILLMVIALIVKLLWNFDGDDGAGAQNAKATESSGLLSSSKEEILFNSISYGTTTEEDLESAGYKGSCSSSYSSEDLYDGKICVICYDEQRNCFFIPCGHCVACFNCAKRIMSEEIKSCPICRTFINKVAKLRIL